MRFELYILLLFMVLIAVTDYRKHIIPDEYIIAIIIFRILYSVFMNTLSELFISIGYALLITVPLLLLTLWMEKKTGKTQLGGGDIKLLQLFFLKLTSMGIPLFCSIILDFVACSFSDKLP